MATIFFFSFQNRELQIMRKLDHCNIVRLRWFFYSSGEKVSNFFLILCKTVLFFFSGEILSLKILMHLIEMYRVAAGYVVLFAVRWT